MSTKLDVGNVFERVFAAYRDQFTLLIPAALVVFLPIAIIDGLAGSSGGVLLAFASLILGLVGTFWYQGMVVEAVRDIMDGRRDHTVGTLLSSVTPVLARLIGAGLLAGLGIGLGLIALIVPGLFLMTIWAVLAPVIVVERAGVGAAFSRSRELVKGHGWQVFGVIVVLFLVTIVLSTLLQVLLVAVADNVAGYAISSLLSNLLIAPLFALAATVVYFELRRLHGEDAPAAAPPAPAGPEAVV